jgi:hypothetical protein
MRAAVAVNKDTYKECTVISRDGEYWHVQLDHCPVENPDPSDRTVSDCNSIFEKVCIAPALKVELTLSGKLTN